MGASVRPEQSGAPGTPIPATEAELASRRTQPTNSQSAQATEGGAPTQTGASVVPPAPPATELTQEQKLLLEQNRALERLQRENQELLRRVSDTSARVQRLESPPPSDQERDEAFWRNPTAAVREILQAELKTTVEPINKFIGESKTKTVYDDLKSNLKTQYSDVWSSIEPTIDEFVRNAVSAGNVVNDQLLEVAALTAYGALMRGRIPGAPAPRVSPSPSPSPVMEPAVTTPPHLRPSAPPVPGHERETKPPLRDLDENEKRLMRERGWTQAQYLGFMSLTPDQVVHKTVDKDGNIIDRRRA